MYGSKARIGLLVPSANTIVEGEFNELKPDGVSVHAARMAITYPTIENLKRMVEDTEMATELVSHARPHIIAFACTAGSLLEGLGWDQQLIEKIKRTADVPVTTTATAVIKAFKELGIKKISVATPYIDELNVLEKKFFEESGFEVLDIQGIELPDGQMDTLSFESISDYARRVDRPQADAVFLSCTNLKALPIIAPLEEELGKYVFSSNVATYWDVMRTLGLKEPVTGMGHLLGSI